MQNDVADGPLFGKTLTEDLDLFKGGRTSTSIEHGWRDRGSVHQGVRYFHTFLKSLTAHSASQYLGHTQSVARFFSAVFVGL